LSKYTFEEVERLSDEYPVPALLIHSAADCGREFRGMAAILQPASDNPCLVLARPLGVRGVQDILGMLTEWKIKRRGR
jgi:hypothetical protein